MTIMYLSKENLLVLKNRKLRLALTVQYHIHRVSYMSAHILLNFKQVEEKG